MKAVLQRVTSASVTVDGEIVGEIGGGLVVLLGIARSDTPAMAKELAEKTCHLRIFGDDLGKMNRSVQDVGGSALVISQFTLLGDTRRGRRPSFIDAADPETATALYTEYMREIAARGIPVKAGRFGADMKVALVNDGPVTLVLELNGRGSSP